MKFSLSLKNYLTYSTILMLFVQPLVIREFVIDLKLFYIILFLNSIILIVLNQIRINKYVFLAYSFILTHAVLTSIFFKTSWTIWLSQLLGIIVVSSYFYQVIRYIGTSRLWSAYLNLVFINSLIAILIFFFLKQERLMGFFTEPSIFVYVTIPALFYFLKNKQFIKFLILTTSLLLAQSSIGFLGLLLCVLLFAIRKSTIKYFAVATLLMIIILPILLNNVFFQKRLNSTFENWSVITTGEFKQNTNFSSYAYLKSIYISTSNFSDHPLGTGIGTYEIYHDKYIQELKIPKYIKTIKLENINRGDANSMFLRGLSDFGIFWVIITFTLIIYGWLCNVIKYNPRKQAIAVACFIYLLLYLFRGGHYFPEELYFFLTLFLMSGIKLSLKKRICD